MHWLIIALGGALGAISRFAISNLVAHSFAQPLLLHPQKSIPLAINPYATLIVNVIGSLLIGFAYVLIIEKMQLSPQWRQFSMVGFLAAFTTFSTFSLDSILMLESGHYVQAIAYIIASLILCILACWLALVLARLL